MKIIGSFPKIRLRRLRKSKWIRDLVSETTISKNDLILPIFIREGKNKIEPIKSMPGVNRYSVDKLSKILEQVKKYKIPPKLKNKNYIHDENYRKDFRKWMNEIWNIKDKTIDDLKF